MKKQRIGFWQWLWKQRPKIKDWYKENSDEIKVALLVCGFFAAIFAVIIFAVEVAIILRSPLLAVPIAIPLAFLLAEYMFYRLDEEDC